MSSHNYGKNCQCYYPMDEFPEKHGEPSGVVIECFGKRLDAGRSLRSLFIMEPCDQHLDEYLAYNNYDSCHVEILEDNRSGKMKEWW